MKIYYPITESAFFRVDGYKIPFDECIRMGGLTYGHSKLFYKRLYYNGCSSL